MLRGVRNIVFHHSLSVTRTISLVIKSKADIGNVIYTDPTLYKNQPWKRQQATSTITKYAIHSGLDENGAETAELGGGAHSGGSGIDKFERYTTLIRDKDGHQMYFYRKSDGTFWDRIHVPTDSTANADIWGRNGDYVRITKEQFDKKEPPKK